MTTHDLAARRPGQAGGRLQNANTRAKNIMKRMVIGGSHPTLASCYKIQRLKRMRSAYGKAAFLKTPIIATEWAYALRIRMAGRL